MELVKGVPITEYCDDQQLSMSLSAGARLGPYEIVALLGAGAMGEVYRARDSRLGRDVAVKVLPAGVAADPERLRRFEYEARAAAALNHPNILAVFDIGEHEGSPYIVSELLDGETLRERLQGLATGSSGGANAAASAEQTRLPVRKALELAIQVANGLSAAHEKGIVHRDLKPENLFLTTDGRAKILDFGLAKLTQAEPAAASDSVPTNPGTQPGLLLGTVSYMSPEQVRGMAADHRSDIFSFGNILYEMLSGRRAFQRETIADTMSAILKDQPPELNTADRRIPSSVVRIVERCLEKSPAARFQSTHDLAFSLVGAVSALSDVGTVSGDVAAAVPSGRRPQLWMVATIVFFLTTLALAAALLSRRPQETEGALRLSVAVPRGVFQINPMIRVSPDGNQLLFAAMTSDRVSRLWIRPLNALDASPISGTDGASYPFWSPDGLSLGFFADGKLKKIDVRGGTAGGLCDAAPPEAGGTWNADGVIIFSSMGRLHRVSENGGVAVSMNLVNEETERSTLAHPLFLPDGRQYLYLDTGTGGVGEPKIYASALDSTSRTLIVAAASNVWYSQGYLFYLRNTTLMAHAFDPASLTLMGDPSPIAEQVQTAPAGAPRGAFAVSDRTLAYMTGPAARGIPSQLTWFDRNGKTVGMLGEQEDYGDVELSPTGSRAAVSVLNPPNGRDIWISTSIGACRRASRWMRPMTYRWCGRPTNPRGLQLQTERPSRPVRARGKWHWRGRAAHGGHLRQIPHGLVLGRQLLLLQHREPVRCRQPKRPVGAALGRRRQGAPGAELPVQRIPGSVFAGRAMDSVYVERIRTPRSVTPCLFPCSTTRPGFRLRGGTGRGGGAMARRSSTSRLTAGSCPRRSPVKGPNWKSARRGGFSRSVRGAADGIRTTSRLTGDSWCPRPWNARRCRPSRSSSIGCPSFVGRSPPPCRGLHQIDYRMSDARLEVMDPLAGGSSPSRKTCSRSAAAAKATCAYRRRRLAPARRDRTQDGRFVLRDCGSVRHIRQRRARSPSASSTHGDDRARPDQRHRASSSWSTTAGVRRHAWRDAGAAGELRHMAALLEGMRALGSGKVLDEVLALVLDSAIEVTGAERGFIMLADDARSSSS